MNGYNFTERVRKTLAMAREEAIRLRHEYVGTEHILLALLRDDGVGAAVLHHLSVDANALRRRVEELLKPGKTPPRSAPELPYTSRAKKVLELAMTSARDLEHSYVGTEHLLLGLIREQAGIGAQALRESGVTFERARDETVRLLGSEVPARAVGGAAHRAAIRLRSVPADSPRPPGLLPWPTGASSLNASEVRRVEAEAEQIELETDWMHVRNVIELGERTGTPVRLEPAPDGVLWLVLGDNLLRVRVPGSTLPPAGGGARGEGSE